jgi:hypothetical protein
MIDYKYTKLLILFTWIISIQLLYPLPQHQVEILKQQYNENFEAIVWAETQENKSIKIANEEEIEAKYLKFSIKKIWTGWIIMCGVIVLGVLTGFFAIYQLMYWRQFALLLSGIWLIWIVTSIGGGIYRHAESFDISIVKSAMHVINLKIEVLSIVSGVYHKILYIQKEFIFPILHLFIISSLLLRGIRVDLNK